jgi:hypothetical protein
MTVGRYQRVAVSHCDLRNKRVLRVVFFAVHQVQRCLYLCVYLPVAQLGMVKSRHTEDKALSG